VGKHTDALIEQLVNNTEGKTDCKQFNSDDWGGYERVLPPEIKHHIGKDKTQRLERTNGIVRQQTLALASAAEQVWQSVEYDKSHNSVSGELLQLDLAA
jgi:IS1 family transposase